MNSCVKSTIPAIRSLGYHSNFVYNNKYYVIGGVRAEYVDNNDKEGEDIQKKFPQNKIYNSWKELYVYDLKNNDLGSTCWSRFETSGISCPNRLENTAIVVRNDTLVVFGGWNGTEHTNQMWSLDLVSFKWRKIMLNSSQQMRPTPRAGHSMNLVNGDKTIVLFGGQGDRISKTNEFPMDSIKESVKYDHDIYNNQTLFYDFDSVTWRQEDRVLIKANGSDNALSRRAPLPRAYHSCTGVDSVKGGNILFLFGGRNSEYGALNDIWTFDTCNFEWTKVDIPAASFDYPSPRYRHTANQIPNTSSIIFIGGWEKSGTLVESHDSPCFVYDTALGNLTSVDLLVSRAGHACSSVVVEEGGCCILLSGGEITNKENGSRVLTNEIFLLKSD